VDSSRNQTFKLRVPTSVIAKHTGQTEAELDETLRERYGAPSKMALNNVFLGSCFDARHEATVLSLNVRCVICVAEEEESATASDVISVLRCNLPDEVYGPIHSHMPRAFSITTVVLVVIMRKIWHQCTRNGFHCLNIWIEEMCSCIANMVKVRHIAFDIFFFRLTHYRSLCCCDYCMVYG
jgi:hypothetical protein